MTREARLPIGFRQKKMDGKKTTEGDAAAIWESMDLEGMKEESRQLAHTSATVI